MRSRTGCQPCRERHLKCVKTPGSNKCQRCSENDQECVQTSATVRFFRPVKSVRLKGEDGRVAKHDLRFDSGQVWVGIPPTDQAVSFAFFDSDSGTFARPTQGEDVVTDSGPLSPDSSAVQQDDEDQFSLPTAPTQMSPYQSQVNQINTKPTSPEYQQYNISPRIQNHTPSLDSNFLSPSQSSALSRLNSHLSPIMHSTLSPSIWPPAAWPFESAREARLLHHYIKHQSPWIDVCDRQCHFGKELPKRVASYPVIANAIFAFASLHLNLLSGTKDLDSPKYVSKCLQVLIPTLEDPFGHWDENLLATVILLRLHEEMTDEDELCHAYGSTRLLNSIASFASDGGLRESASWVSLRQHIYISLMTQQPVAINLDNYRYSSSFRETDDESWTNRIIFVFAKILTSVFSPDSTITIEKWKSLEEEVLLWESTKPWNFCPLWVGKNENEEFETTVLDKYQPTKRYWPELLVSHPAQVIGLQYFCMSKIILAIYDPQLAKLGFGNLRARKASEKVIVDNMRTILGLTVSNDEVTNAWFQASHMLSTCGSHLSDPKDQDAAVNMLEQMQKRMGWKTAHIIEGLRHGWQS